MRVNPERGEKDEARQALTATATKFEEAVGAGAFDEEAAEELRAMLRELAGLIELDYGEIVDVQEVPAESEDAGAEGEPDLWPGEQLSPPPYQMSRYDWRNEREAAHTQYNDQGLTKNSGAEAAARVERLEALSYGVQKPIDPELESRPRVRHRDVVELALRRGKDVPADVLDRYPNLKERAPELRREGVTVNIVDPGTTVKRYEIAEAERRGLTIEPPELPEPEHFSNIGRYTKNEWSEARAILTQKTTAWNQLNRRLSKLQNKIDNGELPGRNIDGGFGDVSPLSAWYELRDRVHSAIKKKYDGSKETRRPETLREVWAETMLPALELGDKYADAIETDWLFDKSSDAQDVVDDIRRRNLGTLRRGLIKKILSRHHDVSFRGRRERGDMLSPWGLYEIVSGNKTVEDYRQARRERDADRKERYTASLRQSVEDLDVIYEAFRQYVAAGYSIEHLPTVSRYVSDFSGGQVHVERSETSRDYGESIVKRTTKERPRGGRRFRAVARGPRESVKSLFYLMAHLQNAIEERGKAFFETGKPSLALSRLQDEVEAQAIEDTEADAPLRLLYALEEAKEEGGASAEESTDVLRQVRATPSGKLATMLKEEGYQVSDYDALDEVHGAWIEYAQDTPELQGETAKQSRAENWKRFVDESPDFLASVEESTSANESDPDERDAEPSNFGADVLDVPLDELHTDEARFQPRGGSYSEETARRVAEDFDAQLFEPIRPWKDPDDGKWYVLAGHSRLEGMKRRGAGAVPSRPFEGTEEEAIRFALTENDKGDSLTNAERATYIRRLREQGATKTEQKEEARRLYGRDASTVVALSYLNPEGKALDVLSRFQGNALGEANDAETMAVWIGKLRRYHPQLTASHEREIYNYLSENYKTEGRRLSNFPAFREHIEQYINRQSMFGELDGPLNFAEIKPQSQQEREIDRQLKEARHQLAKDQKALRKRRAEYADRNPSEEEWNRILKPHEQAVRVSQRRVIELEKEAHEGRRQLARTEMSLFEQGAAPAMARVNPAPGGAEWQDDAHWANLSLTERSEALLSDRQEVRENPATGGPCAIVTENDGAGGIEVRFPADPGEDVRGQLKDAGFFFYTPNDAPAFWAAERTEERASVARSLDPRSNPEIGTAARLEGSTLVSWPTVAPGKAMRVPDHLAYIGEVLDFEVRSSEEHSGPAFMFCDAGGTMLLIVPISQVWAKDSDAPPESWVAEAQEEAAATMFEEWHGFAPGATELQFEVPPGPAHLAGTAAEITYRSDKIVRPGDEGPGDDHDYQHEFDGFARPVWRRQREGHAPIYQVVGVRIDKHGLLN